VCAFKPQIAYFAAHRAEDQLERLMAHIRRVAPAVPVILDAKRGDIGATAEQYAREAFERYQADAVTLSPFMGFDSIEPYMRYDGKGLILLCRTSNPGGSDLQAQRLAERRACCTSTSRAWPPAPGTATASSAWWWAPPTRPRSPACANWRPRCRC
jgi:orotidine 5'-phosphate decarboxylase subfamily 2